MQHIGINKKYMQCAKTCDVNIIGRFYIYACSKIPSVLGNWLILL
jgi:hypothetical protein